MPLETGSLLPLNSCQEAHFYVGQNRIYLPFAFCHHLGSSLSERSQPLCSLCPPEPPWRCETADITPNPLHFPNGFFFFHLFSVPSTATPQKVWRLHFLQVVSSGQAPSGHNSTQWAGAGLSPRTGSQLFGEDRVGFFFFLPETQIKHP